MTYFDFSFNLYSLLPLVGGLAISGLLVYVARQRYQTGTLHWLELLLLTTAAWSFLQFGLRISGNAEMARLWRLAESSSYIFVAPAALGFCLSFVGLGEWLSRFRAKLYLFGPAVLFCFIALTTDWYKSQQSSELVRLYYGHWTGPAGPAYYAFLLWFNVLVVIALAVLFKFAKRQQGTVRSRQVWLLWIALLIPAVGGAITEMLLPNVFHIEFVQLATLLMTITCFIFSYGILKYQLFSVNPGEVATNILATMHEAVVVFNPSLEVTYANQPVMALLGWQPGQLLGKQLSALVPTAWISTANSLLDKAKVGEVVNAEVGFTHQNSEVISVRMSLSVLHGVGRQVLAYVAVLADLRDLQELLVVRHERDKLQATLATMTDGLLGIDAQGRIVLINAAAERFLAVSTSQATGKLVLDICTFWQDNEQVLLPEVVRLSQPKGQHQRATFTIKAGDKQLFMEVVSAELSDGDPSGMQTILTLHDLTQEQELAKMKFDFTTLASHELRTPLTATRGYLSLLGTTLKGKLSADEQLLLDRTLTSTNRLMYLVQSVLQVSRIEEGKLVLHWEPVNWTALVTKVVGDFNIQASVKKIQIKTNLPSQLVTLEGDASQLEQVLAILLDNAIQYSPEGGLISVHVSLEGQMVRTSVVDQGKGIAKADQAKLFQPYYRVVGELQQSEQGAGLGLFIARSVVEQHKGHMQVVSEANQGATFSFSLPIAITI